MRFAIDWFKRQGMATKQFVFLFLITATLFTFLTWMSLYESKKLFQQQVTRDSQELIAQTNQFLNAYLDNVQNLILFLSTRDDLLEPGNEEKAQQFLQKYRDVNRSVVKTLYFVRADGKVYSDRQLYYDIVGHPQLSDLYALANGENFGINWSEPYDSSLSGQTVAFVRPVENQRNGIVGVVVVELDLESLTKRLMPLLSSKNQTFMIMTAGNNVVATDENSPLLLKDSVYPPKLNEEMVQSLGQLAAGVHEFDQSSRSLVVVKSRTNRFGWSVLSIVDRQFYYESLHKLYKNYRNTAVIWLFVILASSLLISRYFTHPIRQLVVKMDRVKNIDTMSGIAVDREDEIGKLADSYNAMMRRIRGLIKEIKDAEERKKQGEIKVLQSQIGPHFLYNTLACISSLAKQGKMEEVRETVRALVGLLSFSFDRTSEFVTIEEELESIRMYAQIQRIRYGDRFSLHINVSQDIMQCQALKLTLQPLVENAIFHGILPKKRPGTISIYGGKSRGGLKLYVRDDGIGMGRETRLLLFTQERQPSPTKGLNKIGMKNVHERIRMNFGEAYGLRVASRPHVGTIVRVELPIIQDTSGKSLGD